jgi:hypothetical protein
VFFSNFRFPLAKKLWQRLVGFVFDIHLYVGLVEVQKRDLKKLAA